MLIAGSVRGAYACFYSHFVSGFAAWKSLFNKSGISGLISPLYDEVIGLLCEDKQLPEKYRDHALSGELKNYRELRIAPDRLLIYEKKEDTILLLVATDRHTELFN